MPKFNVHIYTIVRVQVNDVEAETPEQAAFKSEGIVNFEGFNRCKLNGAALVESAGETVDFLVDKLDGAGNRIGDEINLTNQAVDEHESAVKLREVL